jgi:hypothetical protein
VPYFAEEVFVFFLFFVFQNRKKSVFKVFFSGLFYGFIGTYLIFITSVKGVVFETNWLLPMTNALGRFLRASLNVPRLIVFFFLNHST